MRRRDPRNSELLRWHAKIRPRGPQEGRDRPEACFQRFDTGSEERATLSCGRKLPRNLGPLLSATAIPRTGVEANAGGPGSLHRALSSGCGCTVRVARLMRLAAKSFVFFMALPSMFSHLLGNKRTADVPTLVCVCGWFVEALARHLH